MKVLKFSETKVHIEVILIQAPEEAFCKQHFAKLIMRRNIFIVPKKSATDEELLMT